MEASGGSLYGLILAGGRSRRMKKDKSTLSFHGVPQTQFCYALLKQFCGQVFLSNRHDQKDDPAHTGFPQLHDEPPFIDIGPLGGILSALTRYPTADWLVVACDLPFVNTVVIEDILSRRNPKKIATAYRSTHDGLPEPLCAVYEHFSLPVLRNFFDNGTICPRKILSNSDIELIAQPEDRALDNINTPEEYERILKFLEKGGK